MIMRSRWWQMLALVLVVGCAPNADELYDEAVAAVAAGDLRTADIHLRNILAEQPDNAPARLLLGRVAVDLGDYASAESQLRRALALGVEPEDVQAPLLSALAGQGRYDDVLAQVEAGPALDGEDRIEQLRIEASAHRALGDFAAAEETFREALELDPDSPVLRSGLAELLLAEGRAEESRSIVAGVLAEDPDFGMALLVRGQLERQAGQLDRADRTLERLVALESEGTLLYIQALAALIELNVVQDELEPAMERAEELLELRPGDPVAAYVMATVEAAQGETDAARVRLEAIVADYPNYAPANTLLGALNAETGQFGQAEMYLQAAIASEPNDIRARLLLSGTYLRQGRVEQARSLLVSIYPSAASDAVMYAVAGRSALDLGDEELAEQYFDRSDESEPASPDERITVASIYTSAREYDRAASLLDSTDLEQVSPAATTDFLQTLIELGGIGEAMRSAEELATRLPSHAWPRMLQGAIQLRAGEYAAARQSFEDAVAIEPGHESSLVNLARVEVLQGNEEAAVATLERVIAINESNAAANLLLAELAIRRGDLDSAAAWLERVPDSVARLRLEGSLAWARGDADESADRFAAVFARAPSADAAVDAYRTALRAGRPDAEAPLRDWLAESPGDVEVNVELGSYEYLQGNEAAAAERFRTALALDPDNISALNNLALLYGESGDERAVGLAQRAYELQPANPAVADTLGWLLVGSGDAEAGLRYIEEAVAVEPEQADIRFHHAVALAETGNEERARAELEGLLAGGEDFPSRAEAERYLANLDPAD